MSLSLVRPPIPSIQTSKGDSAVSKVASEKLRVNPSSRSCRSHVKRFSCTSSYQNGGEVVSDNALFTSGNGQIQEPYLNIQPHKPHNSFPPDFVFGAASASFQVEGATKEGGRGPSIWDTFCEQFKNKVANGASGEPGAGSYHRYKEDVRLLADIGLQAYKFSISWSRVLPKGRGTPNREGLQYYHNLIDELRRNNIEPFVTIFHWDFPQALEDEYGGFLSRRIVEDYKNYANLLFQEFGGKVKHWITMNEPLMFTTLGYGLGLHAPGHCTPDLVFGGVPFTCPAGDSLREPYTVAHNILLAHAEAARLYKDSYQAKDKGQIGITLVSQWFEPYDNQIVTLEAQKRALEFNLGWFLDPLRLGNYPFSMRSLVRERLPIFTEEESNKLKNSFDFIGLNYYTAAYVKDRPYNYTLKPVTYNDDAQIDTTPARGDVLIGPHERDSWIYVYPKGLRKLLLYIKEKYNNPPIYIMENGVMQYNKEHHFSSEATQGAVPSTPIEDIFRMEYHTSHLHELEDALSSRADVKGYFVWSLLDSFEWQDGYTSRYGLNYIDYSNLEHPDLTRRPKQSAKWLKRFLSNINKHKLYETKETADLVLKALPPVDIVSTNA